MKLKRLFVTQFVLCFCILGHTAFAQTTEFTYQGSLKNTGAPANGNFDFEFALFDALTNGNQVGSTVALNNVVVTNGIFAVKIDFGSQFPGADRFLEIRVRPTGGGAFTPLTPRQTLMSTPYAVRSLNSATADSLSSTGSGNFIQNSTSQQTASFNISGDGTAGGMLAGNIINAGIEFQIEGARVLGTSLATANTFVGVSAGVSNTTGDQNTFVGRGTGPGNLMGNNNTFVGAAAGNANKGSNNTAVGRFSGLSITTGTNNTLIGANSNVSSPTLSYAAAIGSDAVVGTDNTIVIGRSGGQDTVQIPGNLTVNGTLNVTLPVGSGNYIQNNPPAQQASSNFNISGNGIVGGVLDVAKRSRFRQNPGDSGPINSAGFLLYQNLPAADRAFVGMQSDNNVGFYGNNGGGWGLTMNTQTGNVTIGTTAAGNDNRLYVVQASTGFAGSSGGVFAQANGAAGAAERWGVRGESNMNGGNDSFGVFGVGTGGISDNIGVAGTGTGNTGDFKIGVLGQASGTGGSNYGGYFFGNVHVAGTLTKGGGAFKIDHPLDPENKFLLHSFVESPDMMNIYNGNIVTDSNGDAVVTLPNWFEALNRDFRYQLTVIGEFAQAMVAEEVKGNQFKLKTDKPGIKVSWQVTGIRHDKFAEENRIKVEEDKRPSDRGKCLYVSLCNGFEIGPRFSNQLPPEEGTKLR